MKRILLLLLIFNATFSFSQTSVYHQFPDSNAVWNFHGVQWMCIPIGPGQAWALWDYSITINGDTNINGINYHQLYVPFTIATLSNCQANFVDGYKGAIREDTATRKVFYYPANDTTEHLLYDFNLEVGDTIRGYLIEFFMPFPWSIPDTVIAIDSVLVGQDYRKRWFINDHFDIYIIEGIGSTFGLFERSPGSATDNSAYSLTCFNQDGISLYPAGSGTCELITSLSDDLSSNDFQIFPNPSHGSVTIQSGHASMLRLELIDLSGRSVQAFDGVGRNEIHLINLPEGLFILKVQFPDNQELRKMIRVEH